LENAKSTNAGRECELCSNTRISTPANNGVFFVSHAERSHSIASIQSHGSYFKIVLRR